MYSKMKERKFRSPTPVELGQIHEFILERLKEVKSMSELVKFHTVHKFMIMAHSPNQLSKLGNIVANHEGLEFSKIIELYEKGLKIAFESEPTTKSHYNTLQHITGHFSADFTTSEKEYFLKMLDSFSKGIIELDEVLKILKNSTAKYDKTYLAKQSYFLLFTEPEIC